MNEAKAELFKLVPKDFIKGLITAIGTAILAGLSLSLNSGKLPDFADFKVIALAGVSAGVAYIGKNFFTNSNDEFAKSEPKP